MDYTLLLIRRKFACLLPYVNTIITDIHFKIIQFKIVTAVKMIYLLKQIGLRIKIARFHTFFENHTARMHF